MTIDADLRASTEFGSWRIQVRNFVDHRRRGYRWWREVGVWFWLSVDGRVRGIVSLGAVTEVEFMEAFGRRWPTTLRPINVEELRSELYLRALRPGIVFDTGPYGRRYQGIRMAIEPCVAKPQALAANERQSAPMGEIAEAMPIIL